MNRSLQRAVSLSAGGVGAALAIGAIAVIAGWRWAALLIVFFAAATAVSRFRADSKSRRAGALLDKTGPRDAIQVLANGGAFALSLVMLLLTGERAWAAFATGALASASSDTWATELGLLSRHPPRSIVSGRMVPAGSSGGVTLAGTVAGVAGALVVAVIAVLLGIGLPLPVMVAGGVAGMLLDSVLGAALQEHRFCPSCSQSTERRVHLCGTATVARGGVPGMNNDVVNAFATVAGGAVSAALWLGMA